MAIYAASKLKITRTENKQEISFKKQVSVKQETGIFTGNLMVCSEDQKIDDSKIGVSIILCIFKLSIN